MLYMQRKTSSFCGLRSADPLTTVTSSSAREPCCWDTALRPPTSPNVCYSPKPRCGCWTRLLVSSAVLRSLNVAWHISCMLSSTGWTVLIVSVTRPRPWSTGVFMASLRSTWWIAVHRSPTSPLDVISALSGAICSPFNVIGSTLTAVGRSRSLHRDLEFTAGRSVRSGIEFWLLQATAEDDTFWSLVPSAH